MLSTCFICVVFYLPLGLLLAGICHEARGRWLPRRKLALIGVATLVCLSASMGRAAEVSTPLAVDLPVDVRQHFRNPDGSCVQCSIGMDAAWLNVPAATTLLEDSQYGHRERGGSGPDRVTAYCKARGIKCHNITGSEDYAWMDWACDTGRGCAIAAGSNHFQTLVGRDAQRGLYYVCNNNSPQKIDVYTTAEFHRLHERSGRWCVVLDYPPPARAPAYVVWWVDPPAIAPKPIVVVQPAVNPLVLPPPERNRW